MRFFLLGAIGILLTGCSAAPELGMREASDPDQEITPAAYRPVLGDYQSRRPAEPQDWQQLNRRVAPGGAYQ